MSDQDRGSMPRLLLFALVDPHQRAQPGHSGPVWDRGSMPRLLLFVLCDAILLLNRGRAVACRYSASLLPRRHNLLLMESLDATASRS
jgi:hypothetical protein